MYTGTLLEFLNMGGGEIMLIMVVVLLLFGGKKLPELARGLGKGIRDFKDASEGVKREIHRNINSMDIDDELNNDTAKPSAATETVKTATETMEEQMYPKTETVSAPVPATPVAAAPAVTVEETHTTATPETEKNKI